MNDTEILVCVDDDNLNTTNNGVWVSCKAYDLEMKARTLSRLG